jgi:hypothetical protein
MYVIADEKDKALHYVFAIDEGYGRDPHVDLCIHINGKHIRYKLPLSDEWNGEALAVARMLREAAVTSSAILAATQSNA